MHRFTMAQDLSYPSRKIPSNEYMLTCLRGACALALTKAYSVLPEVFGRAGESFRGHCRNRSSFLDGTPSSRHYLLFDNVGRS
jgi:hypothetical protein